MKLMIKSITADNFRPFGRVIEYGADLKKRFKVNRFRVVIRERSSIGWRIAYLVVRERKVSKLERHPLSYESFEPLAGRGVLHVCRDAKGSRIESFYLDRPVILNKNIWHAVVTLSREMHIKITENLKVRCVYLRLQQPVSSGKLLYLKSGVRE